MKNEHVLLGTQQQEMSTHHLSNCIPCADLYNKICDLHIICYELTMCYTKYLSIIIFKTNFHLFIFPSFIQ